MRIFATHSITATSMWKLKFFLETKPDFPFNMCSSLTSRSQNMNARWKGKYGTEFHKFTRSFFCLLRAWTVLLTNSSPKHNFPAERQLWTTMEAVSYLGKITSIANLGRQVINGYANMTYAAWNDLYVCSVYWRMKTRAMKQTLLAKNPAHEK